MKGFHLEAAHVVVLPARGPDGLEWRPFGPTRVVRHAEVDERPHEVRPEQAELPRHDCAPVVSRHEHLPREAGDQNEQEDDSASLARRRSMGGAGNWKAERNGYYGETDLWLTEVGDEGDEVADEVEGGVGVGGGRDVGVAVAAQVGRDGAEAPGRQRGHLVAAAVPEVREAVHE